jgi:hypothetical protein
MIIIELIQLRNNIYTKEEENYLAINHKTYETSFGAPPIKKGGYGEESNTSALYGQDTNVTQYPMTMPLRGKHHDNTFTSYNSDIIGEKDEMLEQRKNLY